MNINDLYSYIKQNATDDYDILKNRIDEFSREGLEPIRIYNIISQYIVLKPFCRALDVINGDYIEFVKAIKIATFLKAKFNNENAISVMQKTLVYEDNDVCIFKPTNFQESSIIGEPICCFAYSQGRWDEHYNAYEEAIYYVFDVMRENSIHDFVAITVRPNGRALVLDKNHKWWSRADSIKYIQGLGEGASTIVTKEGKSIKTENKQYNNMNKKLIRLTEGDLHKIVKESVKRMLKEGAYAAFSELIPYTHKTINDLIMMWEKTRVGDGRIVPEQRQMLNALHDIKELIERINNSAVNDGDEDKNPYRL